MRRRSWMIQAAVGWCVLCWLGLGLAQAGTIPPVDGNCHPIASPSVTLTITNLDGNDITDTWLPKPGEKVRLIFKVNDLPISVGSGDVTLVTGPAVNETSFDTNTDGVRETNPFLSPCVTSRYPGNATNDPSDPTVTPSFALDFSRTFNNKAKVHELTPNDWGGMAVLSVVLNGTHKFLIPKDSDVDGIPDIYEDDFGPAFDLGSLTNNADAENPPVFTEPLDVALVGDGLAAFDEYRGFIASGQHVRTDPTQKDLFVHLVNPECAYSEGLSLLGGGSTGGGQPFIPFKCSNGDICADFPTDGIALFNNLNSMISGTQIHLLGFTAGSHNANTTEWIDRFSSYEDPNTFIFTGGSQTAPPEDRQINLNHVFGVPQLVGGSTIQKGIRIIECTDPGDLDASDNPILCTTGTEASCILGFASFGSANEEDNAVINTLRIVQEVDRLFATCTGPGRVTLLDDYSGSPVSGKTRNEIVSQYIRYILAMEIGHSSQLTPTALGSAGFHHLSGTGSVLDQQVQYVSNGTGAACTQQTFRIPELYNDNDRSNSRVRN